MNEEKLLHWIASTGIPPHRVTKVLLLGNSGAGKSFLCNALLQRNAFTHKAQAHSCTDDDAYAGLLFGEGSSRAAFVICNVPGLMESDPANVARNEAAIRAAFGVLPGPTVLVFAMRNTGGRLLSEDFHAMACVREIVKFDTRSLGCVVNKVRWDEVDQNHERYRMAIGLQVRAITGESEVAVDFVGYLPKKVRQQYDHKDMLQLNAQLVTFLQKLRPTSIVPAPDAKMAFDRTQKDEFEVRRAQIGDHTRMCQSDHRDVEREKWNRMVEEMGTRHQDDIAAMSRTFRRPSDGLPNYAHYHGGSGGCFLM